MMARSNPSFSLQRTLAVRFSLTMLAALLGLALWGYLGIRDTLMEQLDQSLRSSARLQVDNLAALGSLPVHKSAALTRFIEDVNRFVVIRDSAGRILTSNTELAHDLPLEATAFRESWQGRGTLVTQPWHGHDFRSIYLPVPRTDRTEAAVVQVGASLIPLEASLSTVLLRMVGTVLLMTIATAIGAGWLAASAVAPMHQITAQARAITGEVAGQRITAHADVSEFYGLTEVLNAMVARLERASQWHRRMIRDLGHDLRTPVTAMRAGVEVALWTERSPDDYRRILASTLEEIDRLSLICDALVLLGRLQAGEVKLDLTDMDARKLAGKLVAEVQGGLVAHTLTLTVSPEPVLIRADSRLMRMVLEQLLDNARRYTPPSSRIEVRVQAHQKEALITVEDNGPGVADDVLPHLFEPFYRNDAARAREGGPGLGLTATAAIVMLHGGMVVAQRGSGGGLRVSVTLPRVESPSGTHPGGHSRSASQCAMEARPVLESAPGASARSTPTAPFVASANAWVTKG
jgi:signal transduction histidine kinase